MAVEVEHPTPSRSTLRGVPGRGSVRSTSPAQCREPRQSPQYAKEVAMRQPRKVRARARVVPSDASAQIALPTVKIQAPGGALEVREGSGDVQRWLTERAVNAPEVFHCRWKTQRSDITSATWLVMQGSLTREPL